jgi:hypothetical protein
MSFLNTFDTLKIVKNGLEMKKLQPRKLEESKTQKKKPHNTTKLVYKYLKHSLYVTLLLSEFKDDLKK